MNELLRNDSLSDMSMRGGLYHILFDWLEVSPCICERLSRSRMKVLSAHEALAGMLAMPQMRPAKSEIVTDGILQGNNQVFVTYEGTSSLRELLENCSIQAQAALRGLQATATNDKSVMMREDRELGKRRSPRRLKEDDKDEKVQLDSFW